jgi:hypothetical protein
MKEIDTEMCPGFSGIEFPCFLFYSRIDSSEYKIFILTLLGRTLVGFFYKLKDMQSMIRANYEIYVSSTSEGLAPLAQAFFNFYDWSNVIPGMGRIEAFQMLNNIQNKI